MHDIGLGREESLLFPRILWDRALFPSSANRLSPGKEGGGGRSWLAVWNSPRGLGLLSLMNPLRLFDWSGYRLGAPRPPSMVLGFVLVLACAEDPMSQGLADENIAEDSNRCQLDPEFFFSTGVVRDGIPALSQPAFLPGDHEGLGTFLEPSDRVVGFVVNGSAFAVPHNILWYHEIANLSLPTPEGQVDLAVTYCPLTGSALVFDRAAVGGAEFGVSGLVFKSNLIMYDRRTEVSLWPQMFAEARCGPEAGEKLSGYPFWEMTWEGWKTLFPGTQVLGEIGLSGPYHRYPYGQYEEEARFGFPMPPADSRRHPKERVLGIKPPTGTTKAFPFGSLASLGPWAAVPFVLGPQRTQAVVFWDSEREAAMAYLPRARGQTLTFEADASGIRDMETGTLWSVDGRATSGVLAGVRLESVEQAFVAFWGAWQAFFPLTDLWGPGKPLPPSLP